MPRKAMNKTAAKVADTAVDVAEEIKEASTEVKKEFSPYDSISCHSVWAGGLNITCPSGGFYEFKDYGYDMDIAYQDLVYLIRKRSDHIFLPRIIIDDEDFLAEFPQVKDFYNSTYSMDELKEILLSPSNVIQKAIESLPDSVLPTLRSLAATMVGNGEIDSIKTVKTLTEIFGANFNLLSELFANE